MGVGIRGGMLRGCGYWVFDMDDINTYILFTQDRPVIVKRAPSSFDVTSVIAMNEPVAQGVCGNCYLHVGKS